MPNFVVCLFIALFWAWGVSSIVAMACLVLIGNLDGPVWDTVRLSALAGFLIGGGWGWNRLKS